MKFNNEWTDYKIIATGDGMKLEKWGGHILLRPDPQVIWPSRMDMYNYKGLSAIYEKSGGGGGWKYLKLIEDGFTVKWRDLTFSLKLMGFKHTGLFPEQAANWDILINLIKTAGKPVNVLNLFGYTGGATVACVSAGAAVCHVDAARAMVDRCGENIRLSGLPKDRVRYIVDDCVKFVEREIKRGRKYDAVIMDPPSYGRGPGGEMWKLEDNIYSLVKLTRDVMSDTPLFHLINSYTTGLQPVVLSNIQSLVMGGRIEAYEVVLPTDEGIYLPCGCSSIFMGKI